MANFGIQLTFLIDADSRDEAVEKVTALMQAGSDAGIGIDAAMIQVETLPTEMGGTCDAPDSKPRLSKAEKERRDMIRRSCDRRMN